MMDLAAVLFVGLAAFAIYGAFELQEQMAGCTRWRRLAWLVLAVVLGWKATDAALYGAPGFPSSDWFLLIALALFLQARFLRHLIEAVRRALTKTPT